MRGGVWTCSEHPAGQLSSPHRKLVPTECATHRNFVCWKQAKICKNQEVHTCRLFFLYPKTFLPLKISSARMPTDHASMASVARMLLSPPQWDARTSGGTYVRLKDRWASSPTLAAHPKSMSVQRLRRGSHMMLPGLMSRCTYPAACRSFSRSAT